MIGRVRLFTPPEKSNLATLAPALDAVCPEGAVVTEFSFVRCGFAEVLPELLKWALAPARPRCLTLWCVTGAHAQYYADLITRSLHRPPQVFIGMYALDVEAAPRA